MATPKQIGAYIMFALFAIHLIPAVGFAYVGISEMQYPIGSEQRTWAYLPLALGVVCLMWGSVSLFSGLGLKNGKRAAWITAIVFCVCNCFLCVVGGLTMVLIPVYAVALWHLCRKRTREHYFGVKSECDGETETIET